MLGDDQDWFDEDFGLSSHKLPQNQAEESAVLPKIELPKVSPKPCEEPLAALYVAEEVEELVHAAAEKLWKCKELGHDLQALSNSRDMNESSEIDDIETISKQIYKQVRQLSHYWEMYKNRRNVSKESPICKKKKCYFGLSDRMQYKTRYGVFVEDRYNEG